MATWNEQLSEIEKLRQRRLESDEALYRTRIELQKINNLIKRLQQGDVTVPDDREDIENLRIRIASLETQLYQLNGEMNAINSATDKSGDIFNLLAFLKKKITTTKSCIKDISGRVEKEKKQPQPDTQKIEAGEKQLEELNLRLQELEKDQEVARKERERLRRRENTALDKKKGVDDRRQRIREELDALQEELTGKSTVPDQDIADVLRKKEELEQDQKRQLTNLKSARTRLQHAIEAIYVERHPRQVIDNLDDGIPFLLMPVRIETRFIDTGNQSELWLRIYPDDIAIHTHEKLLTDKEVAEGKRYWKALFVAEKTGGSEKEDQKKSAWTDVATLFGPQRSAWIARQAKPTNWSDDLSNIPDAGSLVFPVHDLTRSNAWSRAPRTQVLPDKFVVMLYQGNTLVKEVIGNTVPDELFVGPDPLDADNAFVKKDEKLVFGTSFDWSSDFEKAIKMGMGFKIPLTVEEAQEGFEKILVLGTFLSTSETKSQSELQNLIDNHHYSPKGFTLVKQGTPTNNSDLEESGFTKNDPFQNTSYFVETGNPLFKETDDCDGRNLADALGIDYEALQYVLNSNATDDKEAVAMNTALYPATLGYYFDTMLKPVLTDTVHDQLRDFFVQNVTGRGMLPAIRVGNQPYGILLTSDFSKWQLTVRTDPGFPFLKGLLDVLNHYNELWISLLNELMFVGKAGADPSEVLMNILGLQAGSVSFHQRVGYSTDYLRNMDDFKYGGRYFTDMQKNFTSKNYLISFLSKFGYSVVDENNQLRIPQLLRLVFQHYDTLLDAANLVDNVPLSEKERIRYFDEAAKKNYIHWLSEAGSVPVLEAQDFGKDKKPSTALLYLQLRRALLLQLHKSSVKWFKKHDIALDSTLNAVNFHNIRPEPTVTRWEVMKAKVGVALPDHQQKNRSVAEYLLTSGIDENEADFLRTMKSALSFLADLPTARLERCFTEHLDLCTYRLDAWQNALFRLRLKKQRRVQNDNERQERKKGIYLGAYGWVENVRPVSKRIVVADEVPEKLRPANNAPLYEYADNGGFVHAPSLNHASAAAVLRSGYLSHANSTQPDLMSVNLSSERVRRALFVLQGMRNGQSLEALLGYQFERGLHDRASADNTLMQLNLYIYDFRDAYPIEQHQVHQQGTTTITEAIPANNVVNGIKLAETSLPFPYGATGAVISASAGEINAIEQEKSRLADTLDAVKDLLLSESVFQLVQGNFERSGAVVNALKDAVIPPELDVINTPRSHHFTFTNRVTVQFPVLDPDVPANNPWAPIPMSPRARMEPGVNQWLKTTLGDAADLIFRTAHLKADGTEAGFEIVSVDKLNIQPIDLIYISGNELNTGQNQKNKENNTAVSELESRIAFYYRGAHTLEDEVPVRIEFLKPDIAAGKKTLGRLLPLLRSLKTLITDSRHLHAEDFDPPSKSGSVNKANPKGYDAATLLLRVQGAQLVFQGHLNDLHALAVTATVTDKEGNVTVCTNLKQLFDALDAAKMEIADVAPVFGNVQAVQLLNLLVRISNFGLADSFPQVGTAVSDDKKRKLLEQARNVARKVKDASAKATELITAAAGITETERKVNKLLEAGKALYGDVFNILPLFTYNNGAEIQKSDADRPQLLKHATDKLKMNFAADEWLQNVSHVRPRLARWDYIRTLHELYTGDVLELKPVQLPYRAKDSWIAVEFPANDPLDPKEPFNITHDTLSVTIHGEPAFVTAAKQSGILIDDWTEVIPTKEEITGVAFNYNQPNATPPQALLLAVPPQEKGRWSWDDLVGILNDTLLRAKLRAVEPHLLNKLNKPELGVLLPAILSNFSQYDLDLALDYRLNVEFYATNIPVTAIATKI